jgi:hypothetical protein
VLRSKSHKTPKIVDCCTFQYTPVFWTTSAVVYRFFKNQKSLTLTTVCKHDYALNGFESGKHDTAPWTTHPPRALFKLGRKIWNLGKDGKEESELSLVLETTSISIFIYGQICDNSSHCCYRRSLSLRINYILVEHTKLFTLSLSRFRGRMFNKLQL